MPFQQYLFAITRLNLHGSAKRTESCSTPKLFHGTLFLSHHPLWVLCMENQDDHDASGILRNIVKRWQRKLTAGLNTGLIVGTVKGGMSWHHLQSRSDQKKTYEKVELKNMNTKIVRRELLL